MLASRLSLMIYIVISVLVVFVSVARCEIPTAEYGLCSLVNSTDPAVCNSVGTCNPATSTCESCAFNRLGPNCDKRTPTCRDYLGNFPTIRAMTTQRMYNLNLTTGIVEDDLDFVVDPTFDFVSLTQTAPKTNRIFRVEYSSSQKATRIAYYHGDSGLLNGTLVINDAKWISHMFITPDEKYLVVTYDSVDGLSFLRAISFPNFTTAIEKSVSTPNLVPGVGAIVYQEDSGTIESVYLASVDRLLHIPISGTSNQFIFPNSERPLSVTYNPTYKSIFCLLRDTSNNVVLREFKFFSFSPAMITLPNEVSSKGFAVWGAKFDSTYSRLYTLWQNNLMTVIDLVIMEVASVSYLLPTDSDDMFIYFSIAPSPKTDVGCSGRGTCLDIETCSCPTGYTGQYCQYPICNGYSLDGRVGGSYLSLFESPFSMDANFNLYFYPEGYKLDGASYTPTSDFRPLFAGIKGGGERFVYFGVRDATPANHYVVAQFNDYSYTWLYTTDLPFYSISSVATISSNAYYYVFGYDATGRIQIQRGYLGSTTPALANQFLTAEESEQVGDLLFGIADCNYFYDCFAVGYNRTTSQYSVLRIQYPGSFYKQILPINPLSTVTGITATYPHVYISTLSHGIYRLSSPYDGSSFIHLSSWPSSVSTKKKVLASDVSTNNRNLVYSRFEDSIAVIRLPQPSLNVSTRSFALSAPNSQFTLARISYTESSTVCNGRGTCDAPESCTCATGYTGQYCQNAICYGKVSTDPTVCNGHGSCPSYDFCFCDSYYSGAECQYPTCYGYSSFHSSACSGHGTCMTPNNCSCDPLWIGNDCSGAPCFNLKKNDANVCSGHGSCISLDTCACTPDFSGHNCSAPVCYNISSLSPSTCSGHGLCAAVDTCLCDANWIYANCSGAPCFGHSKHSPDVCSAHGTCVGLDTCSCFDGYAGANCSLDACYGFISNDPLVCSSHGSCVARDTCVCSDVYSGPSCSLAPCYGVEKNASNVCSGHGTCVGLDTCSCDAGYGGTICADTLCFGTPETSPSVCSGHGSCVGIDTCVCVNNYTGSSCGSAPCFNIQSTDFTNVCSGHGTCSSLDSCSCIPGWGGSSCQHPTCSSVISVDINVCSGHGSCDSPNNCSCSSGYLGANCSTHTCFELLPSDSSVCSGNGSCVSKDLCSCRSGFRGLTCSEPERCPLGYTNFPDCNIPICYNLLATDPLACSGHGTCTGPDNCECLVGRQGSRCEYVSCYGDTPSTSCSSHGQCLTADQCTCASGYSGPKCSLISCRGRTSVDPNRCNRRGNCLVPDVCSCNSGYSGADCEHFVCNGRSAVNSAVCSGHGTCTGINQCQCQTGWTGSDCQSPVCYSIPSTQTATVCSGHGICSSPDSCTCSAGWTGSTCQTPICYSILGTSSSVCSGHGQCIGADSCVCQSGWTGSSCSVPLCNGIVASSEARCNSRGTCISANLCNCTVEWGGNDCQHQVCNSKFGADACFSAVPSVKNPPATIAHGSCTSFNNCTCNSNYYGTDCEHTTCYGVDSQNSTVCSAHGSCVNFDECKCDKGWFGDLCNTTTSCYGVESSSPNVCSGRGTCVFETIGSTVTSRCECPTQYGGDQCQYDGCFGYASADPEVCSSHGKCISPGTCQCSVGYTGSSCQFTLCYSKSSNNSNVCSGHGKCVGYNKCTCDVGYTTSAKSSEPCDSATCFGKTNAQGACGYSKGRGQCIQPDVCSCTSGKATGSQCEIHMCYGISSSDSQVCGGHGYCTDVDTCACESGYGGTNCGEPTCTLISASQYTVCTGNGLCVGKDNCSCIDGYEGIWCETPVCFGVRATEIDRVCSNGGGFCIAPDTCQCHQGFSGAKCEVFSCGGKLATSAGVCNNRGTCVSSDTCQCNSGYTGPNCEFPMCGGVSAQNIFSVCGGYGNCTEPDRCICEPGYSLSSDGKTCVPQTLSCHGRLATSTSVCSGHGTCISKDQCQCLSGYSGRQCETSSCFGVSSNSFSTCSGNGQCVAKDVCDCNPGFFNADCSGFKCDGMLPSNSSICNKRGRCISPDTCICDAGYTGSDCSAIFCFGRSSTSSSVCGGGGRCTAPNTCVCNPGYSSADCSITSCFGVSQDSELSCSGHGTCVAYNNCTCSTGYEGVDCSNAVCYGKSGTAACGGSSQGSCTSPDTCTCTSSYTGTQCETPICYGLAADSLYACNHPFGNCSAPDTCSCEIGYSGSQCDLPSCYNVVTTDSSVCSSHGRCVARDKCVCDRGYTGQSCSTPVCFNRNADTASVCSSHGTCVVPNTCTCSSSVATGFWYGQDCSSCQPNYRNAGSNLCSEKFCEAATTCNGHGTCASLDSCSCQDSDATGHWAAPFCRTCTSNYYGSNCNQFCDASTTCSGHGSCNTLTGLCDCFNSTTNGFFSGSSCNLCQSGYGGSECKCSDASDCSGHGSCTSSGSCNCFSSAGTGFWNDTQCSSCQLNYYGSNCQQFCEPSTTCSGHGRCRSSDGACECAKNDIEGYWDGSTCSQCLFPYVGSSCLSLISTAFRLSTNGDKLIGTVKFNSTLRSIPCESLFDAVSLKLLGEGPFCWWPNKDSTNIEINFGSSSGIVPGSILKVDASPFISRTDYISVKVVPPLAPAIPTAVISAKSSIGSCDVLNLDGSLSVSPDRRPLQYQWRLSSGFRIQEVNRYLFTQNQPVVKLGDILRPGYTYVVQLTVVNVFGISSPTVSHTVTKSSVAVALAKIVGTSTQTTYARDFFSLFGTAQLTDCFYDNKEIIYRWRQTCGPSVVPTFASNNRRMIFDNTFPLLESTYCFSLTTIPVANPSATSSASVRVNVLLKPLQPSIKGGSRMVTRNAPLVLDARGSRDPDNTPSTPKFSWTCVEEANGQLCSASVSSYLNSSSLITIPANILETKKYQFKLTYTKDTRTTTASVVIDVVSTTPPVIDIQDIPAKVNPSDKLLLRALILNSTAGETFTYQWTCDQLNLENLDTVSYNRPIYRELSIRPTAFSPGITYTFKLQVTNSFNLASYAEVSTTLNFRPQPGSCRAVPLDGTFIATQGTAFTSVYQISANNWNDEDVPLSYSYHAIDPVSGRRLLLAPASTTNQVVNVRIPVSSTADKNYTLSIVCTITDVFGGASEATTTAIVLPYTFNVSRPEDGLSVAETKLAQCCNDSSSIYDVTLSVDEQRQSLNEVLKLLNLYRETFFANVNDASALPEQYAVLREFALAKVQGLSFLNSSYGLPATSASISQELEMSESALADKTTLSSEGAVNASRFLLNTLSSYSTMLEPSSVATSILKCASSMLGANMSSNATDQVGETVSNIIDIFTNLMISGQVDGQPETRFSTDSLIVSVARESPDSIVSKSFGDNSTGGVTVPPGLTDSDPNYDSSLRPSINVKLSSFTNNPYDTKVDKTNNAGMGNVVVINFSTDTGTISVNNLKTGLLITVPRTTSAVTLPPRDEEGDIVPTCQFVNETTNSWSDSGCIVQNVTSTYIICNCSHATPFSIFSSFIPNLNLLSPSDVALITKLNGDNISTFIVVMCLAGGYIFLLIVIEICACKTRFQRERERRKIVLRHKDEVRYQPQGSFRSILEQFKVGHIWSAAVWIPRSEYHFNRSQRLTVCYIAILGIMASNALNYGVKQDNQIQFVAAMIISDLVAWPFVIFFTLLFVKLKDRRPPRVIKLDDDKQFKKAVKKEKAVEKNKRKSQVVQPAEDPLITGQLEKKPENKKMQATEVEPTSLSESTASQKEYPESSPNSESPVENFHELPSQESPVENFHDVPEMDDDNKSESGDEETQQSSHTENPLQHSSPDEQVINPWQFLVNNPNIQELENVVEKNTEFSQKDPWSFLKYDNLRETLVTQVHLDHFVDHGKENTEFEKHHKSVLQLYEERLKIFLDRMDEVVDRISSAAMRFVNRHKFLLFLFLIIATIGYFGAASLAVYLVLTQAAWLGIRGAFIIGTIAVVGYVMFLELFYIYIKTKRYKEKRFKWRTTRTTLLSWMICVSLILLLVGGLGAMLYYTIMDYGATYYSVPLHLDMWIVMDVGVTGLIMCAVLWLCCLYRTPKRMTLEERRLRLLKVKKVPLLRRQIFPWWCSSCIYSLAWTWILIMSFILILYGIKFDSTNPDHSNVSTTWLLSSGSSVGQNCFVSKPVSFAIKLVLLNALSSFFDSLFSNVDVDIDFS